MDISTKQQLDKISQIIEVFTSNFKEKVSKDKVSQKNSASINIGM